MAREDLPPLPRAGCAARIAGATLLFQHAQDSSKCTPTLGRFARRMPTPAKCGRGKHLYEAWHRSQSENQVMILAVHSFLDKSAAVHQHVAPQHSHASTYEISCVK